MKYGFFAVYDVQVKTFMRPILARSFGEAERSFSDAVRHPESDYSKHPDDYSLFHIGYFDEESGGVEPVTAPMKVCTARQFIDGTPRLEKEA